MFLTSEPLPPPTGPPVALVAGPLERGPAPVVLGQRKSRITIVYRPILDIQVYRYTGIQVYRYTGIQVYRYTGILVYWYTGGMRHEA